jgi:hypothetical protein
VIISVVFLQLSHLEHPRTELPPKLLHPPPNEVQEGVTQMKHRILPERLHLVMVSKIEIDKEATAMHKQMVLIEVVMRL